MRICSWNVNGLRAILKKGFYESFQKINPDILCLQEIKVDKNSIPEIDLPGYHLIYNSALRKGYSGTAIFTKIKPIYSDIRTELDTLTEEHEGRVILLEFNNFYLLNTYVPNSKSDLSRLSFRYKVWDPKTLMFIKKLQEKKPIIFCGDLNAAHKEIDLKNPNNNHFSAGFTKEERLGVDNYLNDIGVDSFRHFYPNKENVYSWWSYRMNARERNIGWRIDYFIVDNSLKNKLNDAYIFTEIMGSDHAPVGIDIF